MRIPAYPSDLTGEQWAPIEPLLPPEHWDGRKESHPRRDIVDAILYVNQTGCPRRYLPADFPPWQTVYWHFRRWEDQRVTEQIVRAAATPAAMTSARRPRDASGSCSPTPKACSWP